MSEFSRRNFIRSAAGATAGIYGLAASKLTQDARGAAIEPTTAPSTVCPKSVAPAETIWALKIAELDVLSYSEPFQHQPEQRLPLTCLQGLVNRQQPRIYLCYDRFDERWLEWLRERGDVREIKWVGTEQLYAEFLPTVSKLVVTDPEIPATINVATMLAATEGWLPITPRLLPLFDLPVGLDLRGRWQKDIEAYQWFYATYGDQLTNRACACLGPAIFELRDYCVEFKIPLFWVSPHDAPKPGRKSPRNLQLNLAASPAEEEQFVRDLLLKLPANIPCLGWWDHGVAGQEEIGEQVGVSLASEYGKFQVCTAFDGYCRGFSNLSVHSGTTATFRQKTYPPPALENKVYLAYVRTDGDGPNFWRQAYRELWDSPAHGQVPVAWQLGTATYDLCPDVLDYYYRRATPNDAFINGVCGIGYIHEREFASKLPADRRNAVWDEYIELSSRYYQLFDLSTVTTWGSMSRQLFAKFTHFKNVQGIFADYLRRGGTTAKNVTMEIEGVPVFRAVTGNASLLGTPTGRKRAIAETIKDIKDVLPTERPAFLHVSLTNWAVDMSVLVDIARELGPEFVLVRPEHLAALYKTARDRRGGK